MQIVLVSGLSGSGKSIAIAVLEDVGYYCVDNLPLAMLQPLVDYLQREGHDRIAIAIDARSGASFTQLPLIAEALRNQGADLRVIFLEAKTLSLVKRFSETRRRHPLSATAFRCRRPSSSNARRSPRSRRWRTASTPATSPPRRCGYGSRT